MATGLQVVEIARKELGYTEGRNNQNKYGAWYGMNYQPWCNIFLCWCFYQAGAANLIPRSASVGVTMRWFQNNGYLPIDYDKCEPGDIVIYRASGIFRAGESHAYKNDGHIEMITSYGLDNYGRVTSIGGNTAGGKKVAEHKWSSNKIYYIYRPHFDTQVKIVSDNKWLLGNIITTDDNGVIHGQLAEGLDVSNCIRLRVKDSKTDVMHQIQHVVRTDENGNAHWISKTLKKLNDTNSLHRKVLAGEFSVTSTLGFSYQSTLNITLNVSFYKPKKYHGTITLVKNLNSSNQGWRLFINEDNKLSMYTKHKNGLTQIKTIDSFIFQTTSRIETEPGDYYNEKTHTLEWKNADGSTKAGYADKYTIGRDEYKLELSKQKNSNIIYIKINGVQAGNFDFSTNGLYFLQNSVNQLVIGDYIVQSNRYFPITFISSTLYIEGILANGSAMTFNANCDDVKISTNTPYLPLREA